MIEIGRYFPSFTMDNFFTNEEFEYLSNLDFSDHTEKNLNPEKIQTKELDIIRTEQDIEMKMAIYHHFDKSNDVIKKLFGRIFSDAYATKYLPGNYPISQVSYDNIFFPGLTTLNLHILQSFQPYTVHHDFNQIGVGHQLDVGVIPNPAWTMIIPLDDYNSHTINYKQQPKDLANKDIIRWIKNENPPILNKITDKEYEKYFHDSAPFHRSFMKYLEIERVFKWKKNKLYAASRYNYHSSDNFLINNLTEKRAVVMWTCF